MVALRSRSLELLLGGRLEELTYQQVCHLVEERVSERFDLDFKGEHYGRSDHEKRALASDVAALANTAGGVIILGIAEDKMACAAQASGVSLSDEEQRRIRLTVAANAVPLPAFDLIPVAEPGNDDQGFLLIAVPRSLAAPHAVIVNEAFRYPKRNGTTTRYLTEPEVAAAYRDRFSITHRQGERVDEVERNALANLAPTNIPWLVVSMVPDLPGDLMVDHQALQAFRSSSVGKSPMLIQSTGPHLMRVAVGQSRLIADDSMNDSQGARSTGVELHGDGSGVFALRLYDPRPSHRIDESDNLLRASDEHIVYGLLSALRYLALHARDRSRAGGSATLRARLLTPKLPNSIMLVQARGFSEQVGHLTQLGQVTSTDRVAGVDDLASDGPTLVAAAHQLATDIFQSFGHAEAAQLTRDGEIRRPYWHAEFFPALHQWAKQEGVDIRADALPG